MSTRGYSLPCMLYRGGGERGEHGMHCSSQPSSRPFKQALASFGRGHTEMLQPPRNKAGGAGGWLEQHWRMTTLKKKRLGRM